jgi:hypothetical protein
MKKQSILPIVAITFAIGLSSCMPTSYFTTDIKNRILADSVSLDKLQFYVDRDVELRREVSSGNMQVTSGKVVFQNGKYIHIIKLKRLTPGICSKVHNNSMEINFEVGDGKTLTFGVTGVASPTEVYRLFANEWINVDGGKVGKITYDKQVYYIQPGGEGARLMIKKSVIDNLKVDSKTMSGVKIK